MLMFLIFIRFVGQCFQAQGEESIQRCSSQSPIVYKYFDKT